jgi:hypothetical protein
VVACPRSVGEFATCQLMHNAILPARRIRTCNPRNPQTLVEASVLGGLIKPVGVRDGEMIGVGGLFA